MCILQVKNDPLALDWLLCNEIIDQILPIKYIRLVDSAGQPCTPQCCSNNKNKGQSEKTDDCVWSLSTNAMTGNANNKKYGQWQNHKLLGIGTDQMFYLREEQYYCQKHDCFVNTTQALKKNYLYEGSHLNHSFHKIGDYFFTEECCRFFVVAINFFFFFGCSFVFQFEITHQQTNRSLWRAFQKPRGGYNIKEISRFLYNRIAANACSKIKEKIAQLHYIPTRIKYFICTMVMQLQNKIPSDATFDNLILNYMFDREVVPYTQEYWDEALLSDSIIGRIDGHIQSTKNIKAKEKSTGEKLSVETCMLGICGARGLPIHPPWFAKAETTEGYKTVLKNIIRRKFQLFVLDRKRSQTSIYFAILASDYPQITEKAYNLACEELAADPDMQKAGFLDDSM